MPHANPQWRGSFRAARMRYRHADRRYPGRARNGGAALELPESTDVDDLTLIDAFPQWRGSFRAARIHDTRLHHGTVEPPAMEGQL